MKPHRPANALAITAVAVAAALALCELAVRAVFGARYAARPRFYQSDPELGFRPAAGLDHHFYGGDYSIRVRTDSSGYRLGSLGQVDMTGDLVLFCGDSYVFGWGVSTFETCASFLDEMVFERSGGHCRVVNLGVGGYGSWQTALRLERFLAAHPRSRVTAVVFVHVANDATDNAKAIAYPPGVRKTRDREMQPGTPSHLVNMALRAWERFRSPPSGEGVEWRGETPGVQEDAEDGFEDLLFSFDSFGTSRPMPDEVSIGARRVDISGLSRKDEMISMLLGRGEMSRIQSDLILQAVNHAHDILRERGMKIIHTVLPTSPDWFAAGMRDILGHAAGSDWNRVVLAGRFPAVEDFSGDIFNLHSGGHYTPEFNRFWAARLDSLLEAEGAGGPSPDESLR